MARNHDHQTTIRRYLLRQLTDDDQAGIEQRLLAEVDLLEELEITEDELIDEYLAKELSEEERQTFERDFLANPERKQKLRFAKALGRYASAANQKKDLTEPDRVSPIRWWRQSFARAGLSTPPLALAAVVLIVVGLGFAVWRGFLYQSEVDKGLVALNAAYREQRPLEARITQLNYAPFSTTRGTGYVRVNESELRRAELILLDALSKKPTPAVHHALGRVYLAKKEFDKAIEQFEKAREADPSNAQIYADLGAAYLERGKLNRSNASPVNSIEDLARSLENLNKALQLDSNLLEALFNRALSLEEQNLWKQAEAAWNDYLGHDSTSAWAEEGRRRLLELQQRKQDGARNKEQLLDAFMAAYDRRDDEAAWKIVSESYTSAGCPIANHLLNSFLTLGEDHTSDREANLQAFSYLAELEFHRAGDSYHADLARFYTFLPTERRQALAKVQDQMNQAFDYFTKSRSNEAIKLYTSSRQEFERLGNSAEAIFADYRLAHSYAIQPNMEKSKEIFIKLSTECERLQYRWLFGQTLLGLAHISVGQNQYSQAIDFSKRGVALFQSCGYVDGLVRTLRQLAEEYQAINKTAESLAVLQDSLAVAENHFIDPVLRWGLYMTVAFNLDSLGLLTTTAAYQTEALMIALDVQRPLVTSRSYAYLGATYGKLKNFSEAIKNLRRAYETGANLADDPNGMDMMANSSLQLGDLYRATNEFAKALESYDLCLQLYDKLRIPYFNYAAHRGKLLTYVDLQDDSATEEELATILSSLEQYRAGINEESQRNSFFETQQEIYDVAINFAYARKHDPRAAFQYSEMGRARSLLDALQQTGRVGEGSIPEFRLPAVFSPLSLTALQDAMPADVQLIQYAVLDNKSLIWLITRGDFIVREIPVAKDELGRKVRSYLSAIARHSEGKSGPDPVEARELYNLLVAPVEPLLDKKGLVVIVPDKILNYLPFGALRSPESKRYLIEDYNIEVSPSASVFINSSKTATTMAQRDQEKLLSVGNPSFDRVTFSNLQDLPSARREAESITAYYKSPQVLVEEQAREQQIKEQMRNADVVHLALHYVVDERSEMLSKLVLAKEAHAKREIDGALHAYEIYRMKLPQTRLAVLSACQTGIDRNFDGEGAVSIARPFMVAGVPLVVASLWPVESSSTTELMIKFHKHRKLGRHSTVAALRLAQLDLLNDQTLRYQQPYHWASFVLIGGYASF